MKNSFMLGTAVVALALLAGCGTSTNTTSTGASATSSTPAAAANSRYGQTSSNATTTAAAATGAATLVTSKHDKLGTVLAAGPKKLTVYLFEADKGAASTCSGACAAVWPPVTTSSAPQSSASALAADLGTITRSDGSKQVTYKGHPLYYFAKDKDDEDSYGQGSKSFGAGWYVLAPSGNKIDES